jgi:hypothetical protein
MVAVLTEIRPALSRRNLTISIAAGVSTARLRETLGPEARLIRVMPNTPALVLEGVTAIAKGHGLEAGDLETAEALFRAVGKVVVLDEEQMDAVTGLSGSGPGYVAIVIESLRRRREHGLPAPAMTLATQTVLGRPGCSETGSIPVPSRHGQLPTTHRRHRWPGGGGIRARAHHGGNAPPRARVNWPRLGLVPWWQTRGKIAALVTSS